MSQKRALALLRSYQFTLLWVGETVSDIGSRCFDVALVWLVTGLTGSPFLIGVVFTAQYIPTIILQIFGGIWADRVGPFKIIIWSDLLRTVVTFILALLVILGYISISGVIVFVIFYGLVSAFFNPAITVLFASVVLPKDYNSSNALQQIGMRAAELLGPALGGYLISRYSITAAIVFDAVTFAISAIALILIRRKAKKDTEKKVVLESKEGLHTTDMLAGFRFLWQERGLLAVVLLLSLTNAFNNVEAVLVPVLVRFTLKLPAVQYGLLATWFGVGGIIGAIFLNWFGNRIRYRALATCVSFIVFGAAIILIGIAQEIWQLYGEYFLLGFSFAVGETTSSILFLHAIPAHIRGRVFSVLSTISMGLNPVGFLLAGVLGAIYGPRIGLWIGGGAIVILSIFALILPVIRNLDARFTSYDPPGTLDGSP